MGTDVFITSSAAVLPLPAVDNERMEGVLGRAGERPSRARRTVLRNNGIRARHYVLDPETGEPRFTNAQLAAAAVRGLAAEGFALANLRCLVAATSIADQLMPGHGVMVHGELGCPPCEVVTTAGICVAGAAALRYAWLVVRSGEHPNAIACASETSSLHMRGARFSEETARAAADVESNPTLAFDKDFLRWMLSDGAGALLLESAPRAGAASLRLDWIELSSWAHELPVCMYAGGERDERGELRGWAHYTPQEWAARSVFAVKQDVKLLERYVVEYCLERPLASLRARRELDARAIDWFLPHISSEHFRAPVERGLASAGLPIARERWFTNLERCGNTGSASIYIALDELLRSGRLRAGERLLCFVPESGRFSSAFFHLTVV